MVVLAVTWVAHEGQEQEMAEAFERLGAASRQEPGCRMYVVHRHREDKRTFFIYEQYDDDAALQAHRDSPHFQKIVKEDLHLAGRRTDAFLLDPVA
ncbi:Antibiotic biosynthesis monooxygenase [Candidatus Koribacter versatilis Ellin345]|uniref:Antibiotic biosynthesis monooxygenase n=1 Tax=Koribacter versatilis (strain Ellin345) TaxID=204669 RepID=Q1IJT1_KORVE|nr:putative quinol monooxygenase [Candidatus Koribacter versatilis]ABF42869.1 Antibiotic biosynthesis monooxygenase [Candidatus Koribacter versatilis Ellin345]